MLRSLLTCLACTSLIQAGCGESGSHAGAPAGGAAAGVGGTSAGAPSGSGAVAGMSAQAGTTAQAGTGAQGGATALAGNGGTAGIPGTAGDTSVGGLGGEAGMPAATDPLSCGRAASGIAIATTLDPLAYSHHAIDGCTLAYVAPDGALYLRDLSTGGEEQLESPEHAPSRPTLAPGITAWEASYDEHSVVRVHTAEGTVTLEGDFDHAGEPRAADGFVVFTGWTSADPDSDTDVFGYDVPDQTVTLVIGGPGQQRFADVSTVYVAASDFSEDPGGHYVEGGSVSDIVLVVRATGAVTSRSRPEKQAFPMLGKGGLLGYLEWKTVHPEPKFSGFDLYVGTIAGDPSADVLVRSIETNPRIARPSARGDVLDFVDLASGIPVVYRARFDAPTDPSATPLAGATQTFGMVTEPELTLVGVADDVNPAALRVVEH